MPDPAVWKWARKDEPEKPGTAPAQAPSIQPSGMKDPFAEALDYLEKQDQVQDLEERDHAVAEEVEEE